MVEDWRAKQRQESNAAEFIRTHDVPCPACGYDLRGLVTRTCPECGKEFDPVELSSAGSDFTLGEIISAPALQWGTAAVNVILYAIVRLSWGRSPVHVILMAAITLSWWSWTALNQDVDDLARSAYRTPSSILFAWASFGLSRTGQAIVWIPACCLALTGIHIIYVLVCWLGG